MAGMPDGFADALALKYAILQQQANSASQNADTQRITGLASANADNVRAGLLPGETAAQIGLTQAQIGLTAEQQKYYGLEAKARAAAGYGSAAAGYGSGAASQAQAGATNYGVFSQQRSDNAPSNTTTSYTPSFPSVGMPTVRPSSRIGLGAPAAPLLGVTVDRGVKQFQY